MIWLLGIVDASYNVNGGRIEYRREVLVKSEEFVETVDRMDRNETKMVENWFSSWIIL